MELVKKSGDYSIFKKASGRHAVRDADRKWVNGDKKVEILLAEKLITVSKAKPKPAKEEAPAEEAASEETVAEDAPAEEAAEEKAAE